MSAAVDFVLVKVSVNAALVGRDSVVFAQVGAYWYGTVLLPLGAVLPDLATEGAFMAVKLFGNFGDGMVGGDRYWMRYRSSWVSYV